MGSREELILSLVNDLKVKPKQLPILYVAFLWWVVSWCYVVVATLLMGGIREDSHEHWLHHFQLEFLLGFAASFLVMLAAWMSIVPGLLSKRLLYASLFVFSSWLLLYVIGSYEPVVELNMYDKREHCYFEGFLYSVPPLFFAFFLMSRRFALQQWQSGFLMGLAAGLIPALFMQFFCMYEPLHILQSYVLPVVACGFFGAFLFPVVNGWLAKH